MKMHSCIRRTRNYNLVKFEKLKRKYSFDEDIVVEYNLHHTIIEHLSPRDWIGIFPKGWYSIDEYLTLEYAPMACRTSSSLHRSIIFLHNFHKEAVPDVDYEFVYVTEGAKILGISFHFRFALPSNTIPRDRGIHPEAREQEYLVATDGYPPVIVYEDHDDTSKTSIVVPNGASETINGIMPRQRICRLCDTKSAPTIATNRVQFLLSHNEKLVARVGRLERDLELAEMSVKHEKMAQASLTKRLQAYEAFVTGMFKCLSVKGIVKITDKVGKEIIIRRMKPKELSSMHEEVSNKCDPISKAPIFNQSSDNKTYKVEKAEGENQFENIPTKSKSSSDEGNCPEIQLENSGELPSTLMESSSDQNSKNSGVTLSVEDNLPEHDKKISGAALSAVESVVISQCRRLGYTCAKNQIKKEDQSAQKDPCKLDESNYECQLKECESKVDIATQTMNDGNSDTSLLTVSKKHSNCDEDLTKELTKSQQLNGENMEEWALECECDLEVSNRLYQEINNCESVSKYSPGIDLTISDQMYQAMNDTIGNFNCIPPSNSTLSNLTEIVGNKTEKFENEPSNEVPHSKPSAILIKGRNTKFAIIRY